MLTQLSIRNIVLIESVDLTLASGLCVLSGETGAGKSILLDALGLILGARADSGLVRQGEAQGMVSAEFDISGNEGAKSLLQELELEDADTLIIRRSLSADGKTRNLVNDRPVTVAALKRLGERLVEIHGQHDQKTLQDTGLHRAMLDEYGRLDNLRSNVATAYRAWRGARDAIAELNAAIERTAREQEYLQHMRHELKQLSPEPGEEERLSTERSGMMQGEKLHAVLQEAIKDLQSNGGAVTALRDAQRTLMRSPLTSGERFASAIEALERAAIDAEEALYLLEKSASEQSYDPLKLERIEERLFALKAAGRKYHLPVDELAALYEEVERKLQLMESQEHRRGALEKQLATARANFIAIAKELSAERGKAAARLEKAIEKELKPLKMENTRFRVRIEPQDEGGWSEWGMDYVAFECATNVPKGATVIAYAPLNKIASGGELSRFMLAMKVALSSMRSTSTLIFDEIDTGTGGAVADAIGQRLKLLGAHAQVLVVTHLPQVAARGSQHLFVSKQEKGRKVTTRVEMLSPEAREEELARMLAGARVTPEARKAAQKLLEDAL